MIDDENKISDHKKKAEELYYYIVKLLPLIKNREVHVFIMLISDQYGLSSSIFKILIKNKNGEYVDALISIYSHSKNKDEIYKIFKKIQKLYEHDSSDLQEIYIRQNLYSDLKIQMRYNIFTESYELNNLNEQDYWEYMLSKKIPDSAFFQDEILEFKKYYKTHPYEFDFDN